MVARSAGRPDGDGITLEKIKEDLKGKKVLVSGATASAKDDTKCDTDM